MLEVFHGLELLQIEQLTLEMTKEILHNGIVWVIHALPNTFILRHFNILPCAGSASSGQSGAVTLCCLELL